MADAESAIQITENDGRHRFEAVLDGEVAGFVSYRREDDRVVLVHTEVDPRFEGKGVGSALARGVLDRLRDEGVVVVPECEFIAGWIEKHPDYADLVA
jgi:predicted GNAT family acetyltransferase